MIPRVYLAVIEMLENGMSVSKYDIAERAHCHFRTGFEAIKKIRSERNDVRVVGWHPIYNQRVPVYAISDKPDVPKPPRLEDKDRQKKYRINHPEFVESEILKKRARRVAKRLGLSWKNITIHRAS